ncbi:hypothetical protein [Vibrio crassostreae]|uniref:hypothetical protein n=1 Tax=Vibrio crassostreae TaxID=246167 RepID=UPI001B300338|nr:hypothetical protein [Vibrio crassostreae]
MYTRKKFIAQIIAASFLSVASTTNANIQIIPQQSEEVESRFVSTSLKQVDSQEVIKAEFESIPFGIVVDTIKPPEWTVNYLNESENNIVSWSGESPNWIDVVKFISVNNDIIADINYAEKSILLSKESVAQKIPTPVSKPQPKAADSVIECKDVECSKQVINIEKLALDTSWVDAAPKNVVKIVEGMPDMTSPRGVKEVEEAKKVVKNTDLSAIERDEESFDKKLEAEHKRKEARLRREYGATYLLHGNGTFEDFVNGGGALSKGEANPDESYTYVYKQGTLFSSIEKWAELNGYTIKNDVKDKFGKDYGNISTVYLKGDFYAVTTRLLDKYRNAEYPINHKFYKKGKVLHIFSGKYNSSMGGAK